MSFGGRLLDFICEHPWAYFALVFVFTLALSGALAILGGLSD